MDTTPSSRDLCLRMSEVTNDEAWAFAQLLKRAGWDHYRALASNDNEATAMQVFAERLRQALVDSGYAPR